MSTTRRVGRSRAAGGLVVVLLVAVGWLLGASPAAAHDALLGASPADGATVTSVPEQVVLTFGSPVSELGLTVIVAAPSGERVTDGTARVDGRDVVAPLGDLAEPGRYTVAYRVVSSDGHPIQGRTTFVLDVDTDPSTTPSPDPSATPTASSVAPSPTTASPGTDPVASATDAGGSAWPWVLGALALGAIGGGAALARTRARSR